MSTPEENARPTHNSPSDLERVRALLNTGKDPGAAEPETEVEATSAEESRDANESEKINTDQAERDSAPTDEQDNDQAERESEQEPAPLDVAGIAERLELTPAQLYERLQIPLEKGQEPVSLSALKDGYQAATRVEQEAARVADERRAFESSRDEIERQHMIDQRELRSVLDVIRPENLPPELLREMQARERTRRASNREELFRVMPELQDRQKYVEFSGRATDFLSGYGYRPSELASIDDPRTFKLVSDHMRLVARLDEAEQALARAREPKAKPGPTRAARDRSNGTQAPRRNRTRAQELETSAKAHDLINKALRG